MTITTIAFDGDDTLWHHDNYFRAAVDEFHTIMNTLGDFPDAREAIDKKHINDLAIWGYGVKGLILSMVDLAIEMTDGQIAGADIKRLMDVGRKTHLHPVILLDHVAPTLQALKGRFRIVLITKGDLIAQEMKIHKSGLEPFFDIIEIVSEKDVPTYQKILQRHQIKAEEMIMIGNSLRSDIIPPVQLGAQAIHIPYETSWHFEKLMTNEDEKQRFITMESMADLPALIDQLEHSETTELSKLTLSAQLV